MEWFKTSLLKHKKAALFMFTFVSLLYSFYMINQLTNAYDGFWKQDYFVAGDWEVACGRWMWPYLDRLEFGLHIEPLNTLVSLAVFVASYIIILIALDLELPIYREVIGGLIILSSPIFSCILSYRFMATEYAFSCFFASLAALFCSKTKGDIKSVILAALMLDISLGFYQAYIGVFCVVGLLSTLLLALDDNRDISIMLRNGVRYIVSFLIGGVSYFFLMLVHLAVTGNEFVDYDGINQISFTQIVISLPKTVPAAMRTFARYMLGRYINDSTLSAVHLNTLMYLLFFGIFLAAVVKKIVGAKEQKAVRILACVVCLILMPLACNVAMLLSTVTGFMPQMGFPMLMLVGLMFVIASDSDFLKVKKNVPGILLASFVALVIYGQTGQVLTDHLAMKDGLKASISLAQGITEDLKRAGIMKPDKACFFIGKPSRNQTFYRTPAYERANPYARVGDFWLEQTNMYGSYKALFRDVAGINLNVLNDPYDSKAYDEYFATMPCYPDEGYYVNWDTVIIKISEP